MSTNSDAPNMFSEYIVFMENEDGTWYAEISDLGRVRDALGEDILVELCRMLVGADRLDSTIRLLQEISSGERSDQPSGGSDRMSLFLYALATLREMSMAVGGLSRACFEDCLTKAGQENWIRLRQILSRMSHDDEIRYVRNKMAFHIDKQLIRSGINTICFEGKPVGFASGYKQAYKDGRIELGTNTLLAGCRFDKKGFEILVDKVSDDQVRVPSLVYEVVGEIRLQVKI